MQNRVKESLKSTRKNSKSLKKGVKNKENSSKLQLLIATPVINNTIWRKKLTEFVSSFWLRNFHPYKNVGVELDRTTPKIGSNAWKIRPFLVNTQENQSNLEMIRKNSHWKLQTKVFCYCCCLREAAAAVRWCKF